MVEVVDMDQPRSVYLRVINGKRVLQSEDRLRW